MYDYETIFEASYQLASGRRQIGASSCFLFLHRLQSGLVGLDWCFVLDRVGDGVSEMPIDASGLHQPQEPQCG